MVSGQRDDGGSMKVSHVECISNLIVENGRVHHVSLVRSHMRDVFKSRKGNIWT
jgi:hypothetical protein